MDRMNELPFPAALADRDEDGRPDAPSYGAVNVCQNCDRTCERLTLVPEFDYLGCDECMEEALAVIAREAVAMHCPVCGSTRVEELGPFIACVNCKQLWKPARKAVA